jgi:hypothetical protein
MAPRRRSLALAAWVAIALLRCWAMPPAAYGHAGNLLQLYVADLAVRPAGPGGWTVHADVIDADSGRPAPGFDIVASGAAGTGRFGPVTLDDPANTGRYEGIVSGRAGPWTITVEAKARPGGAPAVPFARTWHVVVNDAGTAQPVAGGAAAAPGGPAIQVRVERGSAAGPNEFYVPILVTVLDATTGRPSAQPFDVFAAAANRAGESTEAFPLLELPEDGRHSGFVIVPHGGPWTVTATVNGRLDERNPKPPITYGRGNLDLEVRAGSLGSAGDAPGRGRQPLRGVNVADVVVMWLHAVLGVGWLACGGLLGIMAVPAGRRLLSERARNGLDQRLPVVGRAATWLAGLVTLTGTYNLARSVPYRVPLSVTAARRVFRLPYAEPYFAALALKLAAFVVTVPVVVHLTVRARRAALSHDDAAGPSAAATAQRLNPWRAPVRVPALVGPGAAGAALEPSPPGCTGTDSLPARRPPAVEVPRLRPGRGLVPVVILTTAATTITVAVTVLKYLHLLSEAARAAFG